MGDVCSWLGTRVVEFGADWVDRRKADPRGALKAFIEAVVIIGALSFLLAYCAGRG